MFFGQNKPSSSNLSLPQNKNLLQTSWSMIWKMVAILSSRFWSNSICLCHDKIPREESDGSDFDLRDLSGDTWSDCSDNDKLSSSLSNTSDRSKGVWDGGYEDLTFDPENSWHVHDRDRLGSLHFEYFEWSVPSARVPLIEKVTVTSYYCCILAWSNHVLYFLIFR